MHLLINYQSELQLDLINLNQQSQIQQEILQ